MIIYNCRLFSIENKNQREKFCKIKQEESNGKGKVEIHRCELVKKKYTDRDQDGNISEYEEFFYLLEWSETVSNKKKKSNYLP